jgi:hypothetical protein
MEILIAILVLLLLVCVPIGGTIYVLLRKKKWISLILVAILVLSIPISIAMTERRVEYNENTYAYGWPVPRVVFQRESPEDPYRDFVGWTIIFAYPLNYLLAIFVPVLGCSAGVLLLSRKEKNRMSQPGEVVNASAAVGESDNHLHD